MYIYISSTIYCREYERPFKPGVIGVLWGKHGSFHHFSEGSIRNAAHIKQKTLYLNAIVHCANARPILCDDLQQLRDYVIC